MRVAVILAAAAGAATLGAAAPAATAGDNDIVLSRLARLIDDGGTMRSVGQNVEFRSLVSELGVVLAPRLLAPADTLGFGGFQFAADVGYTAISRDQPFWRARAGSRDPGGLGGGDHGPGYLPTVGFFARKGIWLPLPSFELGAGAVHLLDSGLWTGQVYAKLGLHEGYHDLPIPSVAARGAVSRLFGESDLDLTIVSIDISVSKKLGVGGTWSFEPYGGWSALVIVPRSEVIDPTPHIDPLMPGGEADALLNVVFSDQDNVFRHRFFVGAKLQYYVFQLTLEAQTALAGRSVDDRGGTSEACTLATDTDRCDATDRSGRQDTFVLSAGLDF